MSRLIDRVYSRLHGWLDSKDARPTKQPVSAKYCRRVKLALTNLEERVVPATFTVFNANDSGAGSLRQAITDANANASTPDIIVFDSTFFSTAKTISLLSALPAISDDVTITGPGSKLVTVRRDASVSAAMVILPIINTSADLNVSVSGMSIIGNDTSAITISNETVTLDDLHISGVTMTGSGGGVSVASGGTLTVLNSTITNNGVSASGGAIAALSGAATTTSVTVHNSILSSNTAGISGGAIGLTTSTGNYKLSITNSALVDNIANSATVTAGGGGLFFAGNAVADSVIVRNSTFSGNKAISGGGIVFNTFNGAAHIQNSTIVNNTSTANSTIAGVGGGGIAVTGGSTPSLFIESTIVSGNTASTANKRLDLATTIATTLTVNFSAIGDKSGYSISAGASNLSTADAQPAALRLGPLSIINNMKVHPLLSGSTAIEKGSNPTNITPALTVDQTGNPRVQPLGTGKIDIGAHERIAGVPLALAGPLATVTADQPDVNNPYTFEITYIDDIAINHITLDGSDIIINKVGGGYTTSATLVSIIPVDTNAPTVVATYKFTPPGGLWDFSDNGQYDVRIIADQVKNTSSVAVPAGLIGTFNVKLPAVYTVTNADNSGPGSLRNAIGLANSATSKDIIIFDKSVFSTSQTITLTSGEILISQNLTIQGPGAKFVTITNSSGRAFNISNPGSIDVEISGITISGNVANTAGAAIQINNEKVTLRNMVISDNSTSSGGGAIAASAAGSHLEVISSAIVNNKATGAGGGISISSLGVGNTLILRNSTVSGNSSGNVGGGVYHGNTSAATIFLIENSTITNNTSSGGGGIRSTSNEATVTVVSSIIAGNEGPSGSPDILNFTVNSSFSAIGTSKGWTQGTTSNDLPIGEPLGLLPLADNGGGTFTHEFDATSPLINAGTNPANLLFDQRGAPFARQFGPAVDIGAVEVQPAAAITVTGFEVNNDAAQRSRLTTITVNFSGPVSPASFAALGDIVLTRTAATASGTVGTIVQTGAAGANGLINVTQPGPSNQLVLTFANANAANETAGVEYGSLADGRWQLAIPSASFVSTLNDPALRRLFGDFEAGPPPISNGTVDSSDFGSFGSAFGTSLGVGVSPFDFDNNGTIDSTDFAAFGARFGVSI